jgi:maltose-binding protein MalE
MALSSPIAYLRQRQTQPEEAKEWGVAFTTGVPFVGGSSLTIWKHSRQELAAVKLVGFLTAQRAQSTYCPQSGLLPARLETLDSPEFANDADLALIARGLRRGRSFPAIRLWGLIEAKLADALVQIWKEIFESPAPEIDALLDQYLTPVARSLNKTLSA